jgi:plastocyanin
MTGALYKAALAFIILAGLLAAGSCGSGTPVATTTTVVTTAPSAAGAPTTTTATTTTLASTTAAAPTTTGTPPATASVAITNYIYIPATLTVSVGTMVTWKNNDSVAHTVTTRTALFDSGLFGKDKSFSYTFSQKGEYEYYCIPHPYMTGKVIVQ